MPVRGLTPGARARARHNRRIPLFVEIPPQIPNKLRNFHDHGRRAAGPPGRPDNPDGTRTREPGAKAGSA